MQAQIEALGSEIALLKQSLEKLREIMGALDSTGSDDTASDSDQSGENGENDESSGEDDGT